MRRVVFALVAVAVVALVTVPGGTAQAVDPESSVLCHAEGQDYRPISLPADAPEADIEEHRAHGDLYPGESIPDDGGPGAYLDRDCHPVSWLFGVTFTGSVSVSGGASEGVSFASDIAVVGGGVEFTSADGGVQADFDGDQLTVTVAPGEPALSFAFDFGAWQLWEYELAPASTLPSTLDSFGERQFALETASTEGAPGPQSVTYRLVLEHSAGISPLRNTTIEVGEDALPADGVSTATVTVKLLDVFGEPPVEERVVELFMNQQFGTIGPVSYLGSGEYTATLTAGAAPGDAKIVAMVDYYDLDLAEGHVTIVPLGQSELAD